MATLREWCGQERGRARQLALRAGTTPGTLSKIVNGHRTASLELALEIERATDGQVKAEGVPLSEVSREALRMIRRASRRARDAARRRARA